MDQKNSFTPPYPLSTAVLFLVFNRLDTTKKVFMAIRKAKPPRLYIAADGARKAKEGEEAKVQAVREYIMKNIDWACEVKTLFRDKNLGCKMAVSEAITWFFDNEEMGIILEDDCLPSQSFFWFCEELLETYKNDAEIFCINGNHILNQFDSSSSYYFTIFPNIWGWASWQRVWNQYDVKILQWQIDRNIDCFLNPLLKYEWKRNFDSIVKGLDTWDYQFSYLVFSRNGFCIQSSQNMISNIGFGADATHTTLPNERAEQRTYEINFPLIHTSKKRSYYQENQYTKTRIVKFFKKTLVLFRIHTIIKTVTSHIQRLRSYPQGNKLNIGCGLNIISEDGWINLDIESSKKVFYYNANRSLEFKDNSIKYIYSEHMIEHIELKKAKRFLKECYRVLDSGGIVRIATPNLDIIKNIIDDQTNESLDYIHQIKQHFSLDDRIDVVNLLFYGHGHRYIYNFEKLEKLLHESGFVNIQRQSINNSEHLDLQNRERHGLTVGEKINTFETLIVEAAKK